MLSKAGWIYYFSCSYLWAAISVFNYLGEHNLLTATNTSHAWAVAHSQLGNWASGEHFFPIDQVNISNLAFESLDRDAEKIGDILIMKWSSKLLAIATNAHEIHAALNISTWLHYAYSRWLVSVLTTFFGLLSSPDMEHTMYGQHFEKSKQMFRDSVRILDSEPLISRRPEQNVTATNALTLIEDSTKRLTDSWKQALDQAIDAK